MKENAKTLLIVLAIISALIILGMGLGNPDKSLGEAFIGFLVPPGIVFTLILITEVYTYVRKTYFSNNVGSNKSSLGMAVIQEKTNMYLESMAREFKEFNEDTRKDFDIIKVKVDNLLSRKELC
jgi:hypothetical protein